LIYDVKNRIINPRPQHQETMEKLNKMLEEDGEELNHNSAKHYQNQRDITT